MLLIWLTLPPWDRAGCFFFLLVVALSGMALPPAAFLIVVFRPPRRQMAISLAPGHLGWNLRQPAGWLQLGRVLNLALAVFLRPGFY